MNLVIKRFGGKDVWEIISKYLNKYDKDVLFYSYTNQFSLIKSSKKVSIGFTSYCASKGYLGLLRFAKSHNLVINKKAYHGAIAGNFTETIAYLEKLGCLLSVPALCIAAQHGYINILKRHKWNLNGNIDEYYHNYESKVTIYAARGGQFETLQYLYGVGCKFISYEVQEAILNNHFDLVKYYIEDMGFIRNYDHISANRDMGYHYTLRLMVRNSIYADLQLTQYICAHLNAAKILVGIQRYYDDYDQHLSYYAIKANNVKCYDFLLNSGYIVIYHNDLSRAVLNGGIEIYEYLLTQGLKPNHGLFNLAVRNNKLHFMQYFHDKNYSCKLYNEMRLYIHIETDNWLKQHNYSF